MDKVSIIVPVYNTNKEYLKKCIESLTSQTYKNIELIIIDDGSKDETANYCDLLSKEDDRITVIHKENEGVSVARNTGIQKASGKWLLFVDSDDWMEDNAIESFIDNSNNAQVVIAKDFIDDKKEDRKYESIRIVNDNIDMINNLFMDFPEIQTLGAVWGKMYNRDFIVKNNILFEPGIKMGEDYLYNFEVFYKSSKIAYIIDYVYHYRSDNVDAVTKKFDKNVLEKYKMTFDCFENKFGNIIKEEFESQYNTFVIKQLDYICEINIFNPKNPDTNIERINKLKSLTKTLPFKYAITDVKLKDIFKRRKVFITLLRLKFYGLVKFLYKN